MSSVFPRELTSNYELLTKCRLVIEKDYSESSLKEFENLLNDSQPINDEQKATFNVIYELYKKDKREFVKYISIAKFGHLILWCDGYTIVKWFNLDNILYLRYTDNSYVATRHVNTTAEQHFGYAVDNDYRNKKPNYDRKQQHNNHSDNRRYNDFPMTEKKKKKGTTSRVSGGVVDLLSGKSDEPYSDSEKDTFYEQEFATYNLSTKITNNTKTKDNTKTTTNKRRKCDSDTEVPNVGLMTNTELDKYQESVIEEHKACVIVNKMTNLDIRETSSVPDTTIDTITSTDISATSTATTATNADVAATSADQ